ncbi:chromosome replication/partitioning protein [Borrelia sp. P9F1]|uniref:chromosome replication/partitioning protein n=1 Tax=Borrelia sp. P9F1 TaxID=3058374 RepID=UPI002647BCC0|nr:chromosome replication/partitioning protein [Borrelia sp. P9F1]WKC58475.1 chromosome replication/partitioning protein [Borrelia sp. P9F1]
MKIQKDDKDLNNRIIDSSAYDEKTKKVNRFTELDQELKSLGHRDIVNKIQAMKVLTEIHDELLYLWAGFKSFGAYAKTCFITESTAYSFVKIGQKLKTGEITEELIIKRGLTQIRDIIQNNDYEALKKGEVKPRTIPLRILLPTNTAYSYFKSNTKFTSYALSRLYEEHRELLDNLFYEYSQEKKHRKTHNEEDAIEMEATEGTKQIAE